MSYNHIIVWIDHKEAHVIHFNPEKSEMDVIRTHSTHPHLHIKSGIPGSGHASENAQFFQDIAATLADARAILIVGPGQEKLFFLNHLTEHHPVLAKKVTSVETVDHPTDAQLLAYARKYFVRADRML